MSLRDLLVANGVASKKDATQANRALKEQRKAEQGQRKRHSAQEAEARAAKAAEEAAAIQRRGEIRRAQDRAEQLLAARQQIFSLMRAHELRARGPIRFYHPDIQRRFILFKEIDLKTAKILRKGAAAIAGFDHGGQVEYRIVGSYAAERIREIRPEAVVFWVHGDSPHDVSEEFLEPEWDISLRPHRHLPSPE